jgi:hypothetical protein
VEHTQSIDIQEYKAVVQAYILERTGKKVTIVFDDLMRFNLDFKMLCHAYDIATAYYKNKN